MTPTQQEARRAYDLIVLALAQGIGPTADWFNVLRAFIDAHPDAPPPPTDDARVRELVEVAKDLRRSLAIIHDTEGDGDSGDHFNIVTFELLPRLRAALDALANLGEKVS
jgi:hypothetical protein